MLKTCLDEKYANHLAVYRYLAWSKLDICSLGIDFLRSVNYGKTDPAVKIFEHTQNNQQNLRLTGHYFYMGDLSGGEYQRGIHIYWNHDRIIQSPIYQPRCCFRSAFQCCPVCCGNLNVVPCAEKAAAIKRLPVQMRIQGYLVCCNDCFAFLCNYWKLQPIYLF